METFAPEHSPVAYAFSIARNRPITIRVRLRGPAGRTFSVRALGPDWVDQAALGCMLPWFYWLLPRRRWEQLSVLGDVPSFGVAFPQAQTGEEMTETEATIELRGHRVGSLGVWVSNTSWRWQYRENWARWEDIITTHHRAYCVPAHPVRPWQEEAPESNSRLPWTDALEFACLWASLARQPTEYWRAIVRGIRNLGTLGLLRYRTPSSPPEEAFASPGLERPFNYPR